MVCKRNIFVASTSRIMNKFAAVCGSIFALLTFGGAWTDGCLGADPEASASGNAKPTNAPGVAGAPAGTLLRWHHVGRAVLAQATNATTLRQIDTLPVTDALRGQVSSNMARAALKIWQKDLPAGAADATGYLQPLVHDFLSAEAGVQVRGPIGRTETALAIELSELRASLWSTNLWQLARVWKLGEPRAITVDGFAGWEWKRSAAPNLFQLFRAGKWLVLGLGQDKLTLAPAWLQQAKQSQRPLPALGASLLEVQADLPGLRPWIPILADFPVAPARLTMSGRGENIHTEVRFQFAGKVPWTFEPWRVPTNLVGEPLGSFTVARGVAPWLERIKGLKDLWPKPLPNQFCAWGVTNEICRLFFTVPVTDATNIMKNLAPTLPKFAFDRFSHPLGDFLYLSNRAELIWSGLPYIQPFLRAARGPDTEYLLGGIFFHPTRIIPAPAELYAQLGNRSELLYYDWELTDHRLDHSKQFYDWANMLGSRRPAPSTTASRKWLSAIGPRLHDSVTEITQTGPQELFLVRKSSIGFTGFELATFSAWIDSEGFPFRIDPQPLLGRKANPARTNAPPLKPALPRPP